MKIVKTILKNNKYIYYLYNKIFSFLLKVLGIFCKTDNKLILFNSYGGSKYNDSPRITYEYMKNNSKYSSYTMIWAIDSPNLLNGENVDYVKNNSFKFFITALKAKYWITNSSMERGLKFKKKNTIYINTWHGSAFKKMGINTNTTASKFRTSIPNVFYAQSKHDIDTFSEAFNYPRKVFHLVGLPRNDELKNVSLKDIKTIKEKLKINDNKKVILYAPTFREYCYDKNGCFIAPPINMEKWRKKLSDKYVVLFRAHYEVNKVMNIISDDFIINVTDYPILNDLFKISDILITDYSGIMIDYSILERPIYVYGYDYDEYSQKRGLCDNFENLVPNGIQKNEDELLEELLSCNFKLQKEKTKKFKNMFVKKYGNATKYIDKILIENKNKE